MRATLSLVTPLVTAGFFATGCFQPVDELADLDFSDMSYTAPGLASSTAVVRAFDIETHTCPDGEPARMYAVYAEGAADGGPVALVLHSGAFDFIVSHEDDQEPLEGRHYREESRLERPWALAKVWETIGMLPTSVEAGEDNLGTLTVSMVNQGWVQLYPANCWGDLWHVDQTVNPNDEFTDGFVRDGLGLAATTARMVTEPGFPGEFGVDISVNFDPEQFYIVGLGDGARGVPELLNHPALANAPVAGVLLDSAPDLLSGYYAEPTAWFTEIQGLESIYGPTLPEDPDAISVLRLLEQGRLPASVGYIWSAIDVAIPLSSTLDTALALASDSAPYVVIENRGAGHVFINSDPTLADAMVSWMTTGELNLEAP